MWRPVEEIRADLASQEPSRIAAGLRDAVEAMDDASEPPLPAPTAGLLHVFGKPPAEIQFLLARLLAGYAAFLPPMDFKERLNRLADLAVTWADDRIALEAAMAAKIAADPRAAAATLVDSLAARQPTSPTEILGAGRVASYLIDGRPPVRQATLQAMARHLSTLGDVINHIIPQLEPEERTRFGR